MYCFASYKYEGDVVIEFLWLGQLKVKALMSGFSNSDCVSKLTSTYRRYVPVPVALLSSTHVHVHSGVCAT